MHSVDLSEQITKHIHAKWNFTNIFNLKCILHCILLMLVFFSLFRPELHHHRLLLLLFSIFVGTSAMHIHIRANCRHILFHCILSALVFKYFVVFLRQTQTDCLPLASQNVTYACFYECLSVQIAFSCVLVEDTILTITNQLLPNKRREKKNNKWNRKWREILVWYLCDMPNGVPTCCHKCYIYLYLGRAIGFSPWIFDYVLLKVKWKMYAFPWQYVASRMQLYAQTNDLYMCVFVCVYIHSAIESQPNIGDILFI